MLFVVAAGFPQTNMYSISKWIYNHAPMNQILNRFKWTRLSSSIIGLDCGVCLSVCLLRTRKKKKITNRKMCQFLFAFKLNHKQPQIEWHFQFIFRCISLLFLSCILFSFNFFFCTQCKYNHLSAKLSESHKCACARELILD